MSRNARSVALLALMAGLAPISIHILLPVLPEIERAFQRGGGGGGASQLTLSLGLAAFLAFASFTELMRVRRT